MNTKLMISHVHTHDVLTHPGHKQATMGDKHDPVHVYPRESKTRHYRYSLESKTKNIKTLIIPHLQENRKQSQGIRHT